MAPPDTFGKVQNIDIDHEMRGAYLDYAMSVIVARALPDVRDGLKPVHRRILYAMHDMGLRHDRPYKKSARIVGEVLGKYHPHGDVAVYDAMVRLAQDFSMHYPLIDGQGNFGSVDGDNAAAMRYTEARLSELAGEMLADIDKDTVDFGPNFDDTLKEPQVLPSALPNLLLNGTSGIAVGMATNLPAHNLGEVVDALAFMIDHYHAVDEITLEHLLYYIKGPDFPTGGIVFRYRDSKEGREDTIAKAYASGRGRLTVQAKVHVEAMSRSRTRLVVTELPYQTTNGRVVERIAELVREGRLEGIADLRDESDRQGMRIVVELTRNVEAKDILEQLYKLTPLQQTFGVSALALVNGEPHLLSLKRMLQLFVEHRREIVRRRSEYDLARAKERSHILEGLLIALANLDEVIATIRRSPDTDTARTRLMERFKLSEIQAQAILDMPLKRLSQLERQKLEAEYKELKERIRYLEDLLAHPNKVLGVIKDELLALKAKYGDARRTQIVDVQGPALIASDFLSEEEVLVLLTKSGQLFRQSLAGRRRGSLPRRTADAPIALAAAPARDSLFLFTAAGQSVAKNIHQLPEDEGPHFTEQVDLRADDEIVTALPLTAPEENGDGAGPSLFLYTREGRCKRIAASELLGAAHTSPLVMNVPTGDALAGVVLCDSGDDLLMVTRLGQAIRFSQDDVRVMGLAAAGVLAMKLEPGDQIAGAGLCKPGRQVVLLTTKGVGLRTDVSQFPLQKRYGSGVAAMKLVANQGAIEAVAVVDAEPEMFPILSKGPMRVLRLEDVPLAGRAARGRQVAGLTDGDVQKLLAVVIPRVKEAEVVQDPPPPPPPPPPPSPAKAQREMSPAVKAETVRPASSRRAATTAATVDKPAPPVAKPAPSRKSAATAAPTTEPPPAPPAAEAAPSRKPATGPAIASKPAPEPPATKPAPSRKPAGTAAAASKPAPEPPPAKTASTRKPASVVAASPESPAAKPAPSRKPASTPAAPTKPEGAKPATSPKSASAATKSSEQATAAAKPASSRKPASAPGAAPKPEAAKPAAAPPAKAPKQSPPASPAAAPPTQMTLPEITDAQPGSLDTIKKRVRKTTPGDTSTKSKP